MIQTFYYPGGYIHESIGRDGRSEVRWQLASAPGIVYRAESVQGAKQAITRARRAQQRGER